MTTLFSLRATATAISIGKETNPSHDVLVSDHQRNPCIIYLKKSKRAAGEEREKKCCQGLIRKTSSSGRGPLLRQCLQTFSQNKILWTLFTQEMHLLLSEHNLFVEFQFILFFRYVLMYRGVQQAPVGSFTGK